MDQKKSKSRSGISETCVEKIARLERSYRMGDMIVVKRASLIHELQVAYAKYQLAFNQGDKKEALRWDGTIRAIHRVLDMEIIIDGCA